MNTNLNPGDKNIQLTFKSLDIDECLNLIQNTVVLFWPECIFEITDKREKIAHLDIYKSQKDRDQWKPCNISTSLHDTLISSVIHIGKAKSTLTFTVDEFPSESVSDFVSQIQALMIPQKIETFTFQLPKVNQPLYQTFFCLLSIRI
jgi:hypothetical protein